MAQLVFVVELLTAVSQWKFLPPRHTLLKLVTDQSPGGGRADVQNGATRSAGGGARNVSVCAAHSLRVVATAPVPTPVSAAAAPPFLQQRSKSSHNTHLCV